MYLAGRVADKAPTRDDRKMIADAVHPREAWENAMDIMRERESGWVHARVVSGKIIVLLAQKEGTKGGRCSSLKVARLLEVAKACPCSVASGRSTARLLCTHYTFFIH